MLEVGLRQRIGQVASPLGLGMLGRDLHDPRPSDLTDRDEPLQSLHRIGLGWCCNERTVGIAKSLGIAQEPHAVEGTLGHGPAGHDGPLGLVVGVIAGIPAGRVLRQPLDLVEHLRSALMEHQGGRGLIARGNEAKG